MLYEFLQGELSLEQVFRGVLEERTRSRSEQKAIFAKRQKRGSSVWYNPKAFVLNYKKEKTRWISRKGKKIARRELSGPIISQDGKRVTDKKLIAKIMALPFRKDLTEVHISPNLKGPLLAIGLDAKGKKQSVYSQDRLEKGTQTKFKRVKGFANQIGKIRAAIRTGLASRDPVQAETSLALAIVDATGIRIGTEGTKAIGCTTLLAKNVRIRGGKITLNFMGKSGKKGDYEIVSGPVSRAMKRALEGKKPGDYVFPTITASHVNGFLRSYGDFTAKDFRTHIATRDAFTMAKEAARSLGRKPTAAALKKAYRDILDSVSSTLNNTPAIARKSYINPIAFTPLVEKGLEI